MKLSCPICKSQFSEKIPGIWPFCCERCKILDLAKWSSGEYCIPGRPVQNETPQPIQLVNQEEDSGAGPGDYPGDDIANEDES